MALDEMSGDRQVHDILWGHVCTKCPGNPSNSFQDMSLKITNVKLMVAQDGKSRNH